MRTIVWLVITAISLYLVAPSVIAVVGSAGDLKRISPGWLAGMLALQAATVACMWALQRETLHVRRWSPIVTSQLSSNAISKVAPGGGAVGAALQYRMLVQSGIDSARVVGGLTVANLLTLAVVLAMPLLAVPAIVRGLVPGDLVNVTLTGVGVFVLLAGAGAACLASDRPLRWVGRLVAARPQSRCAATRSRSPGCPSACCTSATAFSSRWGPAGTGRCWRPWDAGRSTTPR